jgi:hypothetical protein
MPHIGSPPPIREPYRPSSTGANETSHTSPSPEGQLPMQSMPIYT